MDCMRGTLFEGAAPWSRHDSTAWLPSLLFSLILLCTHLASQGNQLDVKLYLTNIYVSIRNFSSVLHDCWIAFWVILLKYSSGTISGHSRCSTGPPTLHRY